jgi:lipid A ethanolaminephosphotransferase
MPLPFSTSPRMSPAALTLIASTFLVAACNTAFWRSFISATGHLSLSHIPLIAGSFVLIVMLFNACLTLVSFRHVLKPVLVILFVATALTSYFMNQYGTQIDRSMIQNLVETDVGEAYELLSWRLLLTVALLGVLPSLAVWRVRIESPQGTRGLLRRGAIAAGSLAIAIALLMVFFKSLAPPLREHRELRYLLAPTNYIQAFHSYIKYQHKQAVVVASLGTDALKTVRGNGNRQRAVTLLVVGETARAANFSLNGYARNTNPELARQPDLINFTRVESCGTSTAVSLPCVFSVLGREHYSDAQAYGQEGLLDVLTHAGYKVLWRDNNSGCKGACDRVAYEDLSQPVPGNQWCVNGECYDERLLERLPDIIRDATEDMVIVLHQKGSHGPAYSKRYPAAFKRFTPVCDTIELEQCSRESIVAAYDNTIVYTDHFLNQAIELLKASAASEHVDTAMLYFSDHGESLGEHNMYLHGAPYMISPAEQREVPLMMWMSEGFRSRFQIDQRCVAARAAQPFSHDNVFHSVLGMLGVHTAVYNPRLDIFGPCTHDA